MDISAVLSQARKNQKEFKETTVSRYSTNVKPAKKLPRSNVNPSAIKAFLDKKKDEEIQSLIIAQKKKEDLQKLRHASKSMKKANAMAKRTKDNLKVYQGEDILGLYTEPTKRKRRSAPPLPPLSPEADRKHKAFMKNIVPRVKVPGVNDDDSGDDYKEPVLEEDERKMRKMEKRKAKARSASNLEFSDLLQLAEKHKNKGDESSSSTEDESTSDEDSDGSTDAHGRRLTPEEKYQKERKKRRELEERLKSAGSQKTNHVTKKHEKHQKSLSGNLSNFKIGKLNSGMTEESKRAKVKALMEKLKKSSHEKYNSEGKMVSSETQQKNGEERRRTDKNTGNRNEKPDRSHSSTAPREKRPENVKHKDTEFKTTKPKVHSDKIPKTKLSGNHKDKTTLNRRDNSNKRPLPSHASRKQEKSPIKKSHTELKQSGIANHFKSAKKKSLQANHLSLSPSKPISNPYKHTVVKPASATKRPVTDTFANPWPTSSKGSNPCSNGIKKSRPSAPPTKCTLSVTSESVKTNYPGVAQLDPYIQSYKKTGKVVPKLTPEMVARYKAAMIRKMQQGRGLGRHPPPPKRRYGVLGDDSDDEYDSELEDFIADDNDETIDEEVDVSSQIKAIFGYDRTKYGRESEWEISRMDASYKDIEKEEKRSLRIAKEEDAREAKLEEERMKKMAKKRRR